MEAPTPHLDKFRLTSFHAAILAPAAALDVDKADVSLH
jgi:hypothetical protein